jgi:hypothetical protein
MAQVDAKLEAIRAEVQSLLGQNVDPLHPDLHHLLDAQTGLSGRLEARGRGASTNWKSWSKHFRT